MLSFVPINLAARLEYYIFDQMYVYLKKIVSTYLDEK